MALAQSLPNFIFAWMKLSLAADTDGHGITSSLGAGAGTLISFGSGGGPGPSQAKQEELFMFKGGHGITSFLGAASDSLVSFGFGEGPGISHAKQEVLPIVSILQLGDAKTEQRTTAPGASAPITAPVASDRLARFGAGGGPGLAPVPRIAASSKLRKFRSFGAASGDPVTSAPAFASAAGIPKAFAMELLEVREVQFGILLVVLLISICSAKICVPCLVSRRPVLPPRDDRLGYLFKVQDLETQRSGKYQRSLQSTANVFGSLPH